MKLVEIEGIEDFFKVLQTLGVSLDGMDQDSQTNDLTGVEPEEEESEFYECFKDALEYEADGWSAPVRVCEEFTSALSDNDIIRFNAVDPVGLRWGGVKDTANLYIAFQLRKPVEKDNLDFACVRHPDKSFNKHSGPKREYFLVEDETDRVTSLGRFSHYEDACEYAVENYESELDEANAVVTSLKDLKRIHKLLDEFIRIRG